MTKHTDFINLTNDELLTLTYTKDGVTSLELELAQRLEATMQEVDDLNLAEPSLDVLLSDMETSR